LNVIIPQWETLQSVFSGDIKWVFISSPWFSTEAIQRLITFLPSEKLRQIQKMEVWFRTSAEDYLTGMTDYGALAEFVERIYRELGQEKLELYTSDSLHAKVYATDHRILVTSANLTKNGFEGNVETGVVANLDTSLRSQLDKVMAEQRQRLNEVSIDELMTFVRDLRHAVVDKYRAKVSEVFDSARKHLSLLRIKEEGSPHAQFQLR
jgi:phosphatidylserine/phosphatidylglycerophosphate/cardiolipin synthase-like enzyme